MHLWYRCSNNKAMKTCDRLARRIRCSPTMRPVAPRDNDRPLVAWRAARLLDTLIDCASSGRRDLGRRRIVSGSAVRCGARCALAVAGESCIRTWPAVQPGRDSVVDRGLHVHGGPKMVAPQSGRCARAAPSRRVVHDRLGRGRDRQAPHAALHPFVGEALTSTFRLKWLTSNLCGLSRI